MTQYSTRQCPSQYTFAEKKRNELFNKLFPHWQPQRKGSSADICAGNNNGQHKHKFQTKHQEKINQTTTNKCCRNKDKRLKKLNMTERHHHTLISHGHRQRTAHTNECCTCTCNGKALKDTNQPTNLLSPLFSVSSSFIHHSSMCVCTNVLRVIDIEYFALWRVYMVHPR